MRRRRREVVDPRQQPAYTIAEAAHYLDLPMPTIRYWATGRGNCGALIDVPARHPVLLSFLNLAELHVLAAVRREHAVSMPKVRAAERTGRAVDRTCGAEAMGGC